MAKSLKQVLDQIEKLKREAEGLRTKEVAGVIGRIKEAIAHYGLTPEELFGSGVPGRGLRKAQVSGSTKGTKGKRGGVAKYQSDDGRTWSGVGKRPTWFVEALASGKAAEELLVNPGATAAATAKRTAKGRTKAAKSARTAGVPKYSDGSGKTWTGQGKRPGWFVQALEAGKTAEDLLIKSE